MNKENKRILGWLLVALLIIGSFLMIIFASQGQKTDYEGENDGPVVLAPVTPNEWIKGNINSKVEVVEYSDFQCPACRSRQAQVEKIMEEFGADIKFVYRHFPLKLNHQNAEMAAWASEASGIQGKFWEMHDLLFVNQDAWANLSNQEAKNAFIAYAKQLQLDEAKFLADMESEAVKNAVNEDQAGGLAAGINSTPTFFLNGKKIRPDGYEEFKSLIQKAVEESKSNT